MKKTIFMLGLAMMCLAAAAQAPADTNTSAQSNTQPFRHFTIGFEGGLARNYHQIDMSYMSDMKYDKYVDGATYGMRLQYNPWQWIGLRADAVFIQKSYHMDHVTYLYNQRYATQTHTVNNYVNVPLVLDFSLGGKVFRVHAFGGGYWGYWLTSHRSGVTYPLRGDEADFDEDVDLTQSRFNRQEWGLTYGGGLSLTLWNRLMLNAEARWYYGLTDIQNPYMRNHFPRYNTTLAIQGGLSVKL